MGRTLPGAPLPLLLISLTGCTGSELLSGSIVDEPTLTIRAEPPSVAPGGSSTLVWSSTNATTCSASGGWAGSKPTSASEVVSPSVPTTFTLICNGLGGSTSESVTVQVAPSPPPAGPVAHWSFDEGAGATVQDVAGPNIGSLVGDPRWIPGRIGGGLSFDGVDDHVLVPDHSTLDVTGQLTLAAWINPRSLGHGDQGRIVDKAGGDGTVGYVLRLNSSNGIGFQEHGQTSGVDSAPGVVTLHVWQHVAVVVHGGTNVSLYVDGMDAGGGSLTAPISANAKPLHIGIRDDGSRMFDGSIDEVRVYDRALTPDEVAALYEEEAAHLPPSPMPTVTFTATPPSLSAGESSTLAWTSKDATTCVASEGWSGSKGTSGSEVVSPTATTSYTIACEGPGGSAVVGVTVTVSLPPPALTFGDRVQTTTSLEVRAAPSASATQLGSRGTGSAGTIVGGPVREGATIWWQVDYDATPDGWSLQGGLERLPYPAPESGAGWRSLVAIDATPSPSEKANILARAGIDWDLLKLAEDYSEALAPSDVLVIRHGWIAGEWGSTARQSVASMTKSLTGLAMAKLMDLSDGDRFAQAVGLQSPAYGYLPAAFGDSDPLKRQIRVEHLMTMSSGIRPADPDTLDELERLTYPMDAVPETEWVYSSLPVNLLSMIVEGVSGQSLGAFFNSQIASPIGAEPLQWQSIGRYTMAAAGATVSARDLARIAYLTLQDGVWDSGSGPTQVISASRVTMLTSPAPLLANTTFRDSPGSPFPVSSDAPSHYGHLWWTNATQVGLGPSVPADAYYMHGCFDDLVIVVPSENLIVVRLAQSGTFCTEPDFKSEFMRRVMAALVE